MHRACRRRGPSGLRRVCGAAGPPSWAPRLGPSRFPPPDSGPCKAAPPPTPANTARPRGHVTAPEGPGGARGPWRAPRRSRHPAPLAAGIRAARAGPAQTSSRGASSSAAGASPARPPPAGRSSGPQAHGSMRQAKAARERSRPPRLRLARERRYRKKEWKRKEENSFQRQNSSPPLL